MRNGKRIVHYLPRYTTACFDTEAIGNPDLDDACEKIKEAEGCLRCALMKELLGADDETARYACDHCGGSVMKALEIARKRMSAGRR